MNLSKFSVLACTIALTSCAASYSALDFKNYGGTVSGDNFIQTKDGQVHKFSGVKESSMVKSGYYVVSPTEKYKASDVAAYKINGTEYRMIENSKTTKIASGRINVYLSSEYDMQSKLNANRYYVQKGETGEPVFLYPANAKKKVYDMVSDYEPSKVIMDSYIKAGSPTSMKKVVEAINTYNNR